MSPNIACTTMPLCSVCAGAPPAEPWLAAGQRKSLWAPEASQRPRAKSMRRCRDPSPYNQDHPSVLSVCNQCSFSQVWAVELDLLLLI